MRLKEAEEKAKNKKKEALNAHNFEQMKLDNEIKDIIKVK